MGLEVLNLKQAREQMDDIMDRFARGDWTPVLVGRYGRPPYMVVMPYSMYKALGGPEEMEVEDAGSTD